MRQLYIFPAFRNCNRPANQLVDPFTLKCGNLNDLTAGVFGKTVDVQFFSILSYQIHHINSNDYRNSKFRKLCGQIQVSLQIRSIDDIDDRIRFFTDQEISGYHFFQRVR